MHQVKSLLKTAVGFIATNETAVMKLFVCEKLVIDLVVLLSALYSLASSGEKQRTEESKKRRLCSNFSSLALVST